MRAYLDLLEKITTKGVTVQTGATLPGEGRKPTAKRLFGEQLRFDMADGFPACTTKPLWWRAVVAEWIWFQRGSGDGQYLIDQKVDSIWKSWFKDGTTNLGPAYPVQFRACQGVKCQDRPDPPPPLWLIEGDPHDSCKELMRRGRWLYNGAGINEYALDGWRYVILRHDEGISVHRTGPYDDVVETDQVGNARDDIRAVIADPYNRARRRIIISLWNPAQVPAMALPPCHTFYMLDMAPPLPYRPPGTFTADELPANREELPLGKAHDEDFKSRFAHKLTPEMAACSPCSIGLREAMRWLPAEDKWTLNLHLVARSIDAFTGLPFNVASASLFLHVMARITGCKPGTLLITFNDVHVYDNQFSAVEAQLKREPLQPPTLKFDDRFDEVCKDLTVEEACLLEPEMFELVGYKHHGALERPEVAV